MRSLEGSGRSTPSLVGGFGHGYKLVTKAVAAYDSPSDLVAYARRGLTLLVLGRDTDTAHDLARFRELVPHMWPYLQRVIELSRNPQGGTPPAPSADGSLRLLDNRKTPSKPVAGGISMVCRSLIACVALVLIPVFGHGADKERGLDIYFIDTEGGAATLIITPPGESVLIDCGNPGGRDAERIHHLAAQARLRAIDHLIITHWHLDHYGGVERLSQLMPIHHFYDHGIPQSLAEDPKNFPLLIQAYKRACQGKSRTLKPGDEVALKQQQGRPALRLLCLCGLGEVVADKPGAPENPVAKEHQPQPDDPSDNARSLGFLVSYGGFRFLDLGDLTWNIEYKLVHPSDKIGLVDVYQSTHHGLPISNNPVVIKTVQPRVAVFNNGPRKGGDPSVIATLRRLPQIKAIYQLHRNVTAGPQENTDPEFIANSDEKCRGANIELAVAPDGRSYTVTVGSQGKPRRYETRNATP